MSFAQLRHSQKLRQRRIREKQFMFNIPKSAPVVYRQRELTDQSPFPFGTHKVQGTKCGDVPMAYLRWFLDQEWSVKWPAVLTYAKKKLNNQ